MSRVLPILFNTDMVRAILDGRKTTTRRVIKNLDIEEHNEMITLYEKNEDDAFSVSPIESAKKEMLIYSNYQPGDILYVRESFSEMSYGYEYKADGKEIDHLGNKIIWRPSIHMPKKAARIWLRVTDVRVERLQDITNEQILKEGANRDAINRFIKQMPEESEEYIRASYMVEWSWLWDSTIKKADIEHYGYDANPWVWVIEFERCEKPEKEIHT